ncbi:MAG: cell division protein FtsZ [Promethearchaeia archaeon]
MKLLPNYCTDDYESGNLFSPARHLECINKTLFSQRNQDYDTDDYLSKLVKVLKLKTLVVGIGGAGCNTVSRLEDMGVEGATTLNINTDAHDLYYSNAEKKILIGKETCKGLGSGNNPAIGAEAAKEDQNRLRDLLKADIIFLTCGLGGGTGTGAAPIIAREAKRNGALVITFCTIPFKAEGSLKRLRAKKGLKYLAEYSDTLIPIPNDNLLKIVPSIPLLTCFKILDEVLVRSIREIINIVNNCGIVNVDFADIRGLFERDGDLPSGIIGITESFGQRADLIRKARLALHNPLLNPNTAQIKNCLINVTGNHKLSISQMNDIISTISRDIPESSLLKFGTIIDPQLTSKIRITVLGKGPISPYVRSAVYGA